MRLITTFVTAILLCSGSSHALTRFTGTFEALFLRPSTDDIYFVILAANTADPFGVQVRNHPDYEFGWRLDLRVAPFCRSPSDVRVAWTSYRQRNFARVSAFGPDEAIWLTLGPTDVIGAGTDGRLLNAIATSDMRFRHYALDADVGHTFCFGRCAQIRLFGGGRWAHLRISRDVVYDGDEPISGDRRLIEIRRASQTWGVGPRLGLEFHLALPCRFGAHVQLGYALLSGESCFLSIANRIIDTPVQFRVRNQPNNAVFFEQDFQIGLDYSLWSGRCGQLLVGGGYEITHYRSPIQDSEYVTAPSDGRCLQQYSPFDLQGWYVGIEVRV